MFLKVVLFALCAILGLAQIANAATPACVLAVVGQTQNPANLTDICNDRNMQGMLEDKCKEQDQVKAGLDTFSSVCLSAGITVPINEETSSSSSTSAFETATSKTATSTSKPASTSETASPSEIASTSSKIDSTSKIASTSKIDSTAKIFSKTANATSSSSASQSKTATSKTASKTASRTANATASASESASETGPAATSTESPGATSTSTPSAGREPYYGTVNVVQTILLSMAVAMTLLLAC